MRINKQSQVALVQKVLEACNQQGIVYAVLRNDECLYDDITPFESVDMVVTQANFKQLQQILTKCGFFQRNPQFSLKHKAFVAYTQDLKQVSFDVQVGGVYWNDILYVDEGVLKKHKKKQFYYVLDDITYRTMLLLHSILGKRRFKPKYLEHIGLGEVNRDILLQSFAQKRVEYLLKLKKEKRLASLNCYPYVIAFILKKPKFLWTFTKLIFRWIRWKKFLHPWPLLSFIGPDGAGKTTAAKEVEAFLQGKKDVVYVYTGRGRSHLLPMTALGRAYKKREKKKDKEKKVKKIGLKRRMLYSCIAPLFTLDLLLRYWFVIFPKRLQKKIVITDRYCSDILLMEHVPLWMKKFLMRLFPKPSRTFYLYNDAQVLYERRHEESVGELQRQMNLFELLEKRFSYCRIVTTDQEKDKEKIIRRVMEYVNKGWY